MCSRVFSTSTNHSFSKEIPRQESCDLAFLPYAWHLNQEWSSALTCLQFNKERELEKWE